MSQQERRVQAPTPDQQETLVRAELNKVMQRLPSAMPKFMRDVDPTGASLCSIMLSLSKAKGMDKVSPQEFGRAVIRAALMGLEPDPAFGLLYLVPYGSPPKTVLQPIIGYKGCIELARRSGRVGPVSAMPVYDSDRFEVLYGTEERITHVPDFKTDNSKASPAAFYAIARFLEGGSQSRIMPIWEVLQRRDRSSAVRYAANINKNLGPDERAKETPWDTDFVAMGCKTAVRGLASMLPQCRQLTKALAVEESTERQIEEGHIDVTYEEIMDGSGPPEIKKLQYADFTEAELQGVKDELQTLNMNQAKFRAAVDGWTGTKEEFVASLKEQAERVRKSKQGDKSDAN